VEQRLLEVLDRSRALGFLGPGPVERQRAHAAAWSTLLPHRAAVLDLGSGGGLPGLPLAVARTDLSFVLLDANQQRGRFLDEAVDALELGERVRVVVARAEEAGRSDLRGSFDRVVSRSFAPPAVTAECAAPFLRVGGALLVSEPPGSGGERWPAEGVALLGLEAGALHRLDDATVRELLQRRPCPERFPRAVGRPAKRPLF
jgi:16S rRNA (guanine527-N7)-methyltransferase